jgi:3-oxoacyl-[acyl-carrier-protein] synthase III
LLTSGEQYANPGSCSVPLTLASHTGAAALVAAQSRPRALLAGFGAGLSAAAASVEISPTCERGVVEL